MTKLELYKKAVEAVERNLPNLRVKPFLSSDDPAYQKQCQLYDFNLNKKVTHNENK
jgi:hypothetical protein